MAESSEKRRKKGEAGRVGSWRMPVFPSFDICVSLGQIDCWFHREGRGEREAVPSWEAVAEWNERRRKKGGASWIASWRTPVLPLFRYLRFSRPDRLLVPPRRTRRTRRTRSGAELGGGGRKERKKAKEGRSKLDRIVADAGFPLLSISAFLSARSIAGSTAKDAENAKRYRAGGWPKGTKGGERRAKQAGSDRGGCRFLLLSISAFLSARSTAAAFRPIPRSLGGPVPGPATLTTVGISGFC